MANDEKSEQQRFVLSWGRLLSVHRTEADFSVAKVARHCGVDQSTVRAWELGEAIPERQRLKRLEALLPKLVPARHLIQRERPPRPGTVDIVIPVEQASRAIGRSPGFFAKYRPPIVEENDAEPAPLEPPKSAPPPTEPILEAAVTEVLEADLPAEQLLIPPRTFGAALQYFRKQHGFTTTELGTLAGVTSSTISGWENDVFAPVRENYAKLLDLMPGLRNAPEPDSKDWAIPVGSRPGDGAGRPPAVQSLAHLQKLGVAYADALGGLATTRSLISRLEAELAAARQKEVEDHAAVDAAHAALKAATGI